MQWQNLTKLDPGVLIPLSTPFTMQWFVKDVHVQTAWLGHGEGFVWTEGCQREIDIWSCN
jgi:hypothetical protein